MLVALAEKCGQLGPMLLASSLDLSHMGYVRLEDPCTAIGVRQELTLGLASPQKPLEKPFVMNSSEREQRQHMLLRNTH